MRYRILLFALAMTLPFLSVAQTVTVTPGSAAAYLFSPAAAGATCPNCPNISGKWKLNLAPASITEAPKNTGYTSAQILALPWTAWGTFKPATSGDTTGTFSGILLRNSCEGKVPPAAGGTVNTATCATAPASPSTGFVKCPNSYSFSYTNWMWVTESGAGGGFCAYAYGHWSGSGTYAYAVRVIDIPVQNVAPL